MMNPEEEGTVGNEAATTEKEGVLMAEDDDGTRKQHDFEDPKLNKEGPRENMEREPASPDNLSDRRSMIVLGLALIVIIIVVVAVVLTRDDDDDETPDVVLPAIDFTSGVSLVTYYGINATISQRLARTILTIEVANALDCVSIHGVTLQLPTAARVASLRTMEEDGCSTYGQVQTLEEARDTFAESAQEGLPAAYVEARDSVTYSLQVSMKPYGTTTVELVLEELLRQRVGEVEFQIPLVPNEEVDQVSLYLTVLDVGDALPLAEIPSNETTGDEETSTARAGALGPTFRLELGANMNATNGPLTSPFFLDIPDAREHNLAKLLRGFYQPRALPEHGVLQTDGRCFEMFFLPTDLQSKPRNIFFLLDSSVGWHSNDNDQIFRKMKDAVKTLIDSLTQRDTLTIQVFQRKGTQELWGSAQATEKEKADAKQFLDDLQPTEAGYTNLHEAFLEGLLRAKRDADDEGEAVTLLVLLSNSWAQTGQTNRSKIASDVWNLNSESQVKIFSFGFERSDIELLRAIAIMNGGVATSVLPGTVDFQSQLETFFDSEFGNVLLSDIQVQFSSSDAAVYGETGNFFPVLSQGSEVVVRGLLDSDSSGTLQATTTATTADGDFTWTATAEPTMFTPSTGLPHSLCFQSYAHARITQLMHFRDAAVLLGDETLKPVVKLTTPCNETTTLVKCIEQEALSLALEANVVTRGLTAIVTIDEDKCLSFEGETEVCLDGASENGYWQSQRTDAPGSASAPEGGGGYYAYDESDYDMSDSRNFSHLSIPAMLIGFALFWIQLA